MSALRDAIYTACLRFTFHFPAAPNFIERLPATSGALAIAADNARLSCRVECYPPCQIDWYRNGLPLRDSPMYKIDDFMIPENPQASIRTAFTRGCKLGLKKGK